MRPLALALLVAALALMACGEEDEPAVERPANPIWCPKDEENAFDARSVIGLPVDEAEGLAASGECTVRVVQRDGQMLPVTKDLRFNRINVVVSDGLVVRVASIG